MGESGRAMYFPGTEELSADEMRVVSCGTGMPASRRSQAATCWLVQLGSGDNFVFDIGSGSAANRASLDIPYDSLDRLFLTHLHQDHVGDLVALWIGGGRRTPGTSSSSSSAEGGGCLLEQGEIPFPIGP